MAPRLAVDLSLLLRWTGPPVGIRRVEAEIARRALSRDDTEFVFFDTQIGNFRSVDREAVRAATLGQIALDVSAMPDPRKVRRGPLATFLHRLGPYIGLIRRPRRFFINKLEAVRKLMRSGRVHDTATRLQEKLFNARYRQLLLDEKGERRVFHLIEHVLGPVVDLGPGSVLFSAGADWNTKNLDRLSQLKKQGGWRLVTVCYDLIPVDMPQFFAPRDVEVVTDYFRRILASVDRWVAISHATARDLAAFAEREHLPLGDVRVEPLGADVPALPEGGLPPPLQRGKFILFVSTIEPRKNHSVLLRAWRRLNAKGLPERTGMKLLFVGRRGWNVDRVLKEIDEAENLVHLSHVGDGLLTLLYDNAAFCVYPSLYEEFGLPVIEAFRHGKAVIASTGGAVPEAMQGLGPGVDGEDEDAWTAILEAWMTDPTIVAGHEARIRERFRAVDWDKSASRYIAQALSALDLPPR